MLYAFLPHWMLKASSLWFFFNLIKQLSHWKHVHFPRELKQKRHLSSSYSRNHSGAVRPPAPQNFHLHLSCSLCLFKASSHCQPSFPSPPCTPLGFHLQLHSHQPLPGLETHKVTFNSDMVASNPLLSETGKGTSGRKLRLLPLQPVYIFACKRKKFFVCGFQLGIFHPNSSPLKKHRRKEHMHWKHAFFFFFFFFSALFLIPL